MNVLRSLVVAAAMLGAPAAFAADLAPEPMPQEYAAYSGWYLRGDVGWSFLDWNGGDNDDALTAGGGVGYQWNNWFRTDVRGDFSGKYDVGGGNDLSTITVLGNGYIDFPLTPLFKPYLGAGAGWGWVNDLPGGDDDGFTFALMGGATFDVTQYLAVDVGYRFRDIMVGGPDVKDHSLTAGLRYRF